MSLTAAHITAMLKAAGADGGLVMPAHEVAGAFNSAILEHGGGRFATADQVAALVSECMMESAFFRTTEEYAKHGPYAPFIGRTFIQLTWRDNYARFGAWCHARGLVPSSDYFVAEPARLAATKWAALGGVWYFTEVRFHGKPLTAYAGNIGQVGKAVNLGDPLSKSTPNGQRARKAAYRAVRALGTAIVPTTTPTPEESSVDAEHVPFRGGLTCSCVAESLPWVELDMLLEGLIKESIDIYQLGYRGDVAASAGTHDRGGCTDVAQRSPAHIGIWRKWGWTTQDRSAAFPQDQHAHGWPYGCPHLAPGAVAQEKDWDRMDAGLIGHGHVAGRWPVKDARTALEENKMALLDEITAAVVAGIKKDGSVNIAESVLTGNPKNASVAMTTALDYIGRRLMTLVHAGATKADVAALEAKIDALTKTVAH